MQQKPRFTDLYRDKNSEAPSNKIEKDNETKQGQKYMKVIQKRNDKSSSGSAL